MKNLCSIIVISFLILFSLHQTFLLSSTSSGASGMSFIRTNEPKEKAFSILAPKGWNAEGGIFRVDPLQVGGPLNSIEAKCDLTFKSDQKGTTSFRIFPDVTYAHVGIGGGFFPAGSNYQGAEVKPLLDAQTYLTNLFSYLHPSAQSVKTLENKRLPGEIESMDKGLAYANQLLAQVGLQSQSFKSDAAGAMFEYLEDGVSYHEIIVAGIVNMPAALTWKNIRTLVFRAPTEEFEKWRPVFDIMRFSVRFNQNWVVKECEGQRERAETMMKVYDEIRRIDQEIVKKTTVNREEIMNDNFLMLTEQEEFVNPYTGDVELDTDSYKYRWITEGGDVYYTNREHENPNTYFHKTDYKRSTIRKRRNE